MAIWHGTSKSLSLKNQKCKDLAAGAMLFLKIPISLTQRVFCLNPLPLSKFQIYFVFSFINCDFLTPPPLFPLSLIWWVWISSGTKQSHFYKTLIKRLITKSWVIHNDPIGHFTVVCLVTWPWMQARLELSLLWYRPLCFSHVNAN